MVMARIAGNGRRSRERCPPGASVRKRGGHRRRARTGLLGAATLLFSLVFGVQTLFRWWLGGSVEGFTTVILLQLILGSALMLGLAVIGGYLAMIYDEVKARPLFTIAGETRRDTQDSLASAQQTSPAYAVAVR